MEPRENKQAERAAPAPGIVQTRCQPSVLAPVSPAAFPSNYQTRKSSGQTAIGES